MEFRSDSPRSWRATFKILGVLALIGMVLVLGAIAIGTAGRDDTVTTAAPITTGQTSEEVQHQAAPLIDEATGYLEQITGTSAISDDVANLNAAADTMSEAAAMFVGVDDYMADLLYSAAGHLRASADLYAAGRYGAAAAEMGQFSDDVQAATAAA